MSRYFLEVYYKGTKYNGFQSQKNTDKTIQAIVEKAFEVLQREKVLMTGSSRTDAGVHALQNFFHFDFNGIIHPHFIYKMNAILPNDIVIKNLIPIHKEAHCRFDAVSREYNYYIYQKKNPFLKETAFYFPYNLNEEKLQQTANIIKEYNDFTSFSKRNTQAKTFLCQLMISEWIRKKDCLVYHVKANRFLRGMVRALTATMLMTGRDKLSINQFRKIIEAKDCTKASFAVPASGLFLLAVDYPDHYFKI